MINSHYFMQMFLDCSFRAINLHDSILLTFRLVLVLFLCSLQFPFFPLVGCLKELFLGG